ncbi:MAG: hypothetical protein IH859_09340 [Chloroflexi bacterium]|nr:hypothetical protein [Chloroflexota bacterium]
MNHLEKLTRQYYDWKGYLVKGNVKIGRLPRGGWAGELDIVAYHPQTQHLLHIEPSLDAHSWQEREESFEKKFRLGREFIYKDVFPWLSPKTPLEQIAMLIGSSRKELCGAIVVSIDEFMKQIKNEIQKQGIMAKNAIPEEYDLLRTIQMAINGYYKSV